MGVTINNWLILPFQRNSIIFTLRIKNIYLRQSAPHLRSKIWCFAIGRNRSNIMCITSSLRHKIAKTRLYRWSVQNAHRASKCWMSNKNFWTVPKHNYVLSLQHFDKKQKQCKIYHSSQIQKPSCWQMILILTVIMDDSNDEVAGVRP